MKPYNDYNSYLRAKFGCKVYRIGIDAGFTCPTRDGTKGTGGCLYCDERGSRSIYTKPGQTISQQLAERISLLKETKLAKKFIAYFQAFTNTYAPVEELKRAYDEVLPFKEVVGISIGTRPDAIDEEKLRLIASYTDRYDVWIEYGLQSINDRTLNALRRGHSAHDLIKTVGLTKRFSIPVCAHVILGLPEETREDAMRTAMALAKINIQAVKIHLLHVLRGSALERLYQKRAVKILTQDEYVELVCDFLEYLPRNMVIQRLTGQGPAEDHIAPLWAQDKTGTLRMIEDRFKARGTFQGFRA